MNGFQRYALDERCLNLSLVHVFNGKRLPPVFDAPVVGVKNIGVEKAVVYVAWPLKTENGFAQILRANGQLVWIGDNAIRPLHIAGGTQDGRRVSRPRNGWIAFALDPGVSIRN